MTGKLIVSYYQESGCAVSCVRIFPASADNAEIAEHTFDSDDKWHNLRIVLEDVRVVAVPGIAIYANVPFDLATMPEEPPNVDKYWIPEKGGKGKYIKGKWGGNADYWQVLHLLHEYKSYSVKLIEPQHIPGTVELWQKQFNQ